MTALALARSGFIEIGEARLEYRLWGRSPAASPSIVLLHEGLGCVSLWKEFPERLAAATGLAVLAYSRQGYGGSTPCEVPRPLHYMHHEARSVLPRLLETTGFDSYILLGHSDGASIAAIHAGTIADGRCRGLVLVAPHFFAEEATIKAIAGARTAYDRGGLQLRLAPHHGANLQCAFRGWNEVWLDPAFRQWDIRNVLSRIAVPVLAIQGDADEYGSLAQMDALKEGFVGPLQVEILAGCGHSPHRDRPAEMLELVSRFVAKISAWPAFPVDTAKA